MAKPLSEELQASYAANSIPADLQQYLQKEGILTAKNLANHCDQASEVFDTIIKAHGVHALSNEVKINMKQCWREAMAQTQRGFIACQGPQRVRAKYYVVLSDQQGEKS